MTNPPPYWQAHNITARHGFFGRRGGVSNGPYTSLNARIHSRDDPDAIRHNHHLIAQTLGVDRLFVAQQIHGRTAVVVTPNAHPHDIAQTEADIVVADTPGIAVGVVTADCVPILAVDPVNHIAAACHSGWRGTASNAIDRMITVMITLGASLCEIQAAVGPSIGRSRYVVGTKVKEALSTYHWAFLAIDNTEDQWSVDLARICVQQLRDRRIPHIAQLSRCTYTHVDDFFSYRRECAMSSGNVPNPQRDPPAYGGQLSSIVTP